MRRIAKVLFLLLIALIVPLISFRHFILAAPPTNFQTTQIIGSGLDGPSGFEIAPDGRIFILERSGTVKIFKNGNLLATPFVTLQAEDSGDRGLIGVVFDPNFASNKFVYFYYTASSDLLNKIVRYNAAGDVASGSGTVIFSTTSPSFQLHVGGSLEFGPDGKLYFAVGDNGDTSNPQNLGNPHGKLHRINADGTVPSDNPFFGQAGKMGSIWAYGFRNPWRFHFDSANGRLYVGDVGEATWEEINLVKKGANYGWPIVEGPCPAPCAYEPPIYAYNHNGSSAAVTLGPVYRGTMFPTEYRGKLFFGDYANGFIKTLGLDSNGNSTGDGSFDPNAGSVVDLNVGPDGAMYYITYFPGRLYKITHNLANQTPIANSSADVTEGDDAPLTVNFSSAGSNDPNGDPITFDWDFGDGTGSTAANPTKTYNAQGTYTVELTVSDGTNSAQAVPIVITVGVPPTVTIGDPQEGDRFDAGDEFTYHASAIGGDGLDLQGDDISTDVIFHHQTHTHPFLDDLVGNSNSFTIPTTGEKSAEIWYEIKVTATDENGLTASKSVNIFPNTSNITLATNPAGRQVFFDGTLVGTPLTTPAVVNFEREINAPLQFTSGATNYQFNNWSDGGLIRHTFSTPATNTTYTANYAAMPAFSGQYFNNMTLSGTPVLTRQDPTINFSWGSGGPGSGVSTNNFSARWTKQQHFPAGTFKFTTTTDDGVRLYIDNQLVIDKWVDQAPTSHSANVTLAAGNHEMRMEYFENTGGAVAKLAWEVVDTAPPPPPPTGAYSAHYFDNMTLSGTPAVTRNESEINFDWGGGSPDPVLANDFYSARFLRTDTFEEATYEFSATADDGVRIFVDGVMILDKWIDQPATNYKVSKAMTAGSHEVKVEYYEKTGGAVMMFGYANTGGTPPPPPPPTGGYQGSYWNAGTGSSPTIPTTTATLVRNDADINFNWGGGSPDPVINADHYVARWTGTKTFEAGTYRFTTVSDDGIRVYVDDVLVIDQWNDHGTTTHTGDRVMTAGDHAIKVEYYENTGGAVAQFNFALITAPPPPPMGSFFSEFFGNMTLSGTPVLTRQDNVIDFNWSGSPGAGVPNDKFSARFSKAETFEAGTYEFTVSADDGVRLYIDDVLVIDKWIDQATTTYKVQRVMTAGTHNVRIEFYENLWAAVIKFSMIKL